MTEVTFAKAFLAALDSRPVKLPADHVEDPRGFPSGRPAVRTPSLFLPPLHPALLPPAPEPKLTTPQHILPKMPKKMSKPTTPSTPATTLTITLKSLRNPPLDISLPPQDPTTSIHALKSHVESTSGIPASKLRILYKKKPVPDSKILRELLSDEDVAAGVDALELGVMVLGGAASIRAPVPAPGAAQGTEEKSAVETEEFWGDLRGFLLQRVKDEKEGGELYDMFRGAWEASRKS